MIIIDTNVIMAFLLTNGITRKIIVTGATEFSTPDYCFKELWHYRTRWNRNELGDEELKAIISDVKSLFILSIPKTIYSLKFQEAEKMILDKDDAPVLACALSINNEGLWTYNLKHFRTQEIEKKVRILTTSEIVKMYPFEEYA